MATVAQLDPNAIQPNPENPRLIFRQDELDALQASIRTQGVLVPLTVFEEGRRYVLLDGERRWRCSLKLGLTTVPAIVQPKPDRLTNIMMMFAIHNARKDWDPLPTAYKLQELENEFARRNDRAPSEIELAELASLSRGEVRRLRRLLELPESYRTELMEELNKPRSEQVLTVDLVLETSRGAAALARRDVITPVQEEELRQAIIDKYRNRVVRNTVEPRQLARIARAVERNEIPLAAARRVTMRLIQEPKYTIEQAFRQSVEQVDFEHSVEQLVSRVNTHLKTHLERGYGVGEGLRQALNELASTIRRVLSE